MSRLTEDDERRVEEALTAGIERAGCGPSLVEIPATWARTGAIVAGRAQAAGFRPVPGRALPPADEHDRTWSHRHVALMATTPAEACRIASWVKQLACVSPRGHLVLRFRGARQPAGRRTAGRRLRADVETDDRRLAALVAAADLERAGAWCAALRVEAALLGHRCRDRSLTFEVWLLLWQARHEEAAACCREISDRHLRRTSEALVDWACGGAGARGRWLAAGCGPPAGALPGLAELLRVDVDLTAGRLARANRRLVAVGLRSAPPLVAEGRIHLEALLQRVRSGDAARPRSVTGSGLLRWRSGAAAMYLLPAVPSLLQHLAEADDEAAALACAAAWARHHAGARGVAFVGGEDARLVAVDGWASQAPSAAERQMAARARAPECLVRGGQLLALAPVRYAGAHAGGVLVLGPAARRSTLTEAAGTLAMMCAPALRLRLDQLATLRPSGVLLPEVIGDSPAAVGIRDAVVRAAATPFAVLVEGESGTGKELVARALHRLSARRDRRLVAINCAALSDELVEAELFGHTRGAFTGAVAPRAGLFEDAHGGTIFLDEVAELSARAQAKLLRVLQEREVRRVGETASRAVDVRVVAATNRPLAEACAAGQFRDDLLFRLAVVRIRLAPLRERAEDIAPIARSLWGRALRDVDKRAVIGPDALARLAAYAWPGNVRELQNVVAGLALLAPVRGRVSARHVDHVLADTGAARLPPPVSLERARRACERQTVTAALARHAGRRSAAARELGLSRQGLAKVIRRLHLGDAAIEGVA